VQKVVRVSFYFRTEGFEAFSNILCTVMTVGVIRAVSSLGEGKGGGGGETHPNPRLRRD